MRRLLLAVATVALIGALPAAAAAADGPAPSRLFGVKPLLEGTTTLESGHFAYSLPRSGAVADAAVVINYTNEPLTLATYIADMVAGPDGAHAPAQREDVAKHVGRWARLSDDAQARLTVPPNGRTKVPFALSVPTDAAPGDYLGAFVVAIKSARRGAIDVEMRAALMIRAHVVGTVRTALEVGRPSVKQDGSARTFSVVVRNRGNVLTTIRGALVLTGRAHERLALEPRDIYVIPGGTAHVRARWVEPPAFGNVSARATVKASVHGQKDEDFRSPALRFRIVPWGLLAAGAAAIALAGGVAWLTRGARRRRRTRRAMEREIIRRHREQETVIAVPL